MGVDDDEMIDTIDNSSHTTTTTNKEDVVNVKTELSSSYNNVKTETPTTEEAHKITETASKDQEYTSRIEDLRGGEESSNSNAVDVEWESDQMWQKRR